MKRALVLAGGGVAGIAWELGVLRGIGDADPELLTSLSSADVVIGTSAGSAVAAQIMSGALIDGLYSAQLSKYTSKLEVERTLEDLMARLAAAAAGATGPRDMRRRVAALALETPTVSEPTRRVAVAARLLEDSWPDGALLLTAVDAETGDRVVFTKDSGVDLIDAVAASCAVPGIWPPVTINGHRFVVVVSAQARTPIWPRGAIGSSSSRLRRKVCRNRGATSMTRSTSSRLSMSTSSTPMKPRSPPSERIHSRLDPRREIGRAEADVVGSFWR